MRYVERTKFSDPEIIVRGFIAIRSEAAKEKAEDINNVFSETYFTGKTHDSWVFEVIKGRSYVGQNEVAQRLSELAPFVTDGCLYFEDFNRMETWRYRFEKGRGKWLREDLYELWKDVKDTEGNRNTEIPMYAIFCVSKESGAERLDVVCSSIGQAEKECRKRNAEYQKKGLACFCRMEETKLVVEN